MNKKNKNEFNKYSLKSLWIIYDKYFRIIDQNKAEQKDIKYCKKNIKLVKKAIYLKLIKKSFKMFYKQQNQVNQTNFIKKANEVK